MSERELPRDGRRRRALVAAPAVLGVLLALTVGRLDPPRRTHVEQRYTIPPGTAARVADGLPINQVLPQRLTTRVGETLVVANADTTSHAFGPFMLQPGQAWSQRFALAGDYTMSCSLYPNVDLVIAVAPPADPARISSAVHRAWSALWIGLCAVVACARSVTLVAPGTRAGPAVGGGGDDGAAGVLPRLLPGTALGVVATEALALSRVAPWAAVLASRALVWWIATLALAAAVPALFALAAAYPNLRTHLRLAALATTGVAAAAGVATWLGALAGSVGVAVVAVGLLATASWASVGRDAGPRERDAGAQAGETNADRALAAASGGDVSAAADRGEGPGIAGGLAVAGLVLLVTAAPWPTATPPWVAARGAVVLVVGLAAMAWTARTRWSADPTLGWVTRGGTGLAVAVGAGLLWLAWLGHVEATTVPLAGNPIVADAASIDRGRTVFAAHCAGCHATVPDIGSRTERQLLQYITGGDDDHRFAYRLDLAARGDVANFMRAGPDRRPTPR